MNNLHISLTDFRNESRVIKEACSILEKTSIKKVYVAALHEDGLEELEFYNDRLEIKRFKLSSRKLSKSFLVQIFKYIEFMFRLTLFYHRKHITLINIHALSLLPLGVLLKYIYGAHLIYDTHELETETNGANGVRKKVAKFVERIFIRATDHVFVVSESIADWYANAYKIQRPTVLLNAPKLLHPQRNNFFRARFTISNDQIIMLYQGGLTAGRDIELLLSAFNERRDHKVVIVFMGRGDLEEKIKTMTKTHKNIFFHSAVATNVVLDYTTSADVGISMVSNTCLNHYYCMPNKIFEYAMAGLPVIVSNMKEMRAVVLTYEMGIVVENATVEALNTAIDQLVLKNMDTLKKNSRKMAEANAWEVQEEKMIRVYKSLRFGG
jgi:glycosyltransferase involved in cell wall biosynthesis